MKITIASIVGIVGTVIIMVCGFLKEGKNNQHLLCSTDYKIPLLKCPLHVKTRMFYIGIFLSCTIG